MKQFKKRTWEKPFKSREEKLYQHLSSGYIIAINYYHVKPSKDFYGVARTRKAWIKWYRQKQKEHRINFHRLHRANCATNTCASGVMPWYPRAYRYRAKYITRRNAKRFYHNIEYWQEVFKKRLKEGK